MLIGSHGTWDKQLRQLDTSDILFAGSLQGQDRVDYVAWCQHMRLKDQPALAARILRCIEGEAVPTGNPALRKRSPSMKGRK